MHDEAKKNGSELRRHILEVTKYTFNFLLYITFQIDLPLLLFHSSAFNRLENINTWLVIGKTSEPWNSKSHCINNVAKYLFLFLLTYYVVISLVYRKYAFPLKAPNWKNHVEEQTESDSYMENRNFSAS